MLFKSWPPTCWTERRRSAIGSSRSCCRHREYYTCSSSQVRSPPCSNVLHIPALLLRPALRNPQLDHPHHRHPPPHLLYRRKDLQGEVRLVIYVLRLPPLHHDLDHPRAHRRIRVVQPAASQLRRIVIMAIRLFSKYHRKKGVKWRG